MEVKMTMLEAGIGYEQSKIALFSEKFVRGTCFFCLIFRDVVSRPTPLLRDVRVCCYATIPHTPLVYSPIKRRLSLLCLLLCNVRYGSRAYPLPCPIAYGFATRCPVLTNAARALGWTANRRKFASISATRAPIYGGLAAIYGRNAAFSGRKGAVNKQFQSTRHRTRLRAGFVLGETEFAATVGAVARMLEVRTQDILQVSFPAAPIMLRPL
eukprot:2067669-Rhodomonas_salina.3